jgi:predicted dehydrogenase
MDRRTFLKDTSLATAGVTLLNFPVFGKNAPSNKVVVGVMGLHGRGSYLAGCFSQLPNVEVGYICDIEDGAIKIGFDALKNAPRKPTLVRDIRELVHKPDMDALIVAAPDHWHMPATMLALHAGKHIYVEKPCCHNPHEGEMMVAAAAHAARQVQMGSQRRSMPTLIQAAAEVKDGLIGNTYFAKAWYTNNRASIGYGKRVPVPSTLDFDLWQGPAPRQPYQDNLVHYNWHWFWNWGTGEACNNGTHEVDCCRWLLGVDRRPLCIQRRLANPGHPGCDF